MTNFHWKCSPFVFETTFSHTHGVNDILLHYTTHVIEFIMFCDTPLGKLIKKKERVFASIFCKGIILNFEVLKFFCAYDGIIFRLKLFLIIIYINIGTLKSAHSEGLLRKHAAAVFMFNNIVRRTDDVTLDGGRLSVTFGRDNTDDCGKIVLKSDPRRSGSLAIIFHAFAPEDVVAR